jgi:hypothetical protein
MKSFRYYDMLEQFPRPGCVVCRMLENDFERYISSLLYEYVTTREAHDAFRQRRGLCNRHSWMLFSRREGAVNLAILVEAAVDEVLNTVNGLSVGGWFGRLFGQTADKLLPEKPCVCCTHLADAEKRYMDILQDGFSQKTFVSAYQESDGFCLPHLTQVLRVLDQPAYTEIVLNKQREVLTKLKAELELYRLRYGLRAVAGEEIVEEAMGDEATSWRRAITLLAGGDGLFGGDKG